MRPLRLYSYSNHKEEKTVRTRKIKKKAELLHAIFVIPFAKLGEKRTLGECTCVVKVDMPWSRFFSRGSTLDIPHTVLVLAFLLRKSNTGYISQLLLWSWC